MCIHPTSECFYEGGEEEDGEEWEQYYCRKCGRYLTDPDIEEIRGRPDWITWRTDDDGLG